MWGDHMISISYCGHSYTHDNGIFFDTNRGDAGFDCYLLLFVSTPAEFWVDGEMKLFPAKSVVLFSPGHRKYYRALARRYTNDWIRFESDEEFISSLSQQNVPFLPPDPDYIHNLIQLICWEDNIKNTDSDYITKNLFRILFRKLSSALETDLSLPHYQALVALRKRIKASPSDNWTVSSMADKLHVSPTYLQTLYKKAFDISCMGDVIKTRVELAQDRLTYSSTSITEVAGRCGYQNVEHFCRQFKSITGMTPNEFRKNIRMR